MSYGASITGKTPYSPTTSFRFLKFLKFEGLDDLGALVGALLPVTFELLNGAKPDVNAL